MSKEIIVPDLFVETKQAVADYHSELHLLDEQESELQAELSALQLELTENMLSQENATISDKVYLKIRGKEISSRANIINTVLEEVAEERHALKLKYVAIYRETLSKDGEIKKQYNANEIVNRHVYALFNEIVSIAKQVRQQNATMMPDLSEVLADERVNTEHRNARYIFTHDSYKLPYWEYHKTVVSKQDVLLAVGGEMPSEIAIRKPKEAVSND